MIFSVAMFCAYESSTHEVYADEHIFLVHLGPEYNVESYDIFDIMGQIFEGYKFMDVEPGPDSPELGALIAKEPRQIIALTHGVKSYLKQTKIVPISTFSIVLNNRSEARNYAMANMPENKDGLIEVKVRVGL